MARTISSAALAKLTANYGSEPITIVEIQWVDGGPRISYADRDISPGVKGRILQLDAFDDVVQVSGGSQSQQINIVMDDTDGSIKAIIDSNDIHKRPCWVYQWFDGLDLSDKFLLFRGQINTPIDWKEGDRTISLSVVSKVEDAEVGFSIEEGDFVSPDPALIGQPWPLCFGTVINAPALRLVTPAQGTLESGVGIKDWTLQDKLAAAKKLLCAYQFIGYVPYYAGNASDFNPDGIGYLEGVEEEPSCASSRCKQIKTLEAEIAAQSAYEFQSVLISNGENFPQNVPLALNINGGIFHGSFNGKLFTITDRVHPDLANPLPKTTQGVNVVPDFSTCAVPTGSQKYQFDNANQDIGGPTTQQIQDAQNAFNDIPSSQFFWANPGASVVIQSLEPITYVANILPSTILRVAAYRETDSGQILVTVPPAAYTVQQSDYNGYQVMELIFGRPLSSIGEGWSDDLYVTLTSSVGPNTVDVIKWLIQTYTPYSVDDTSFNHVHDLIDNYPSHFMMPGRLNITDALDKIAYQARCAVWLKDDIFYIKYLSEAPTAVDTITEDDILVGTLELTHTPTEDLITKYKATYKTDYAQTKDDIIIYRSNVKKYGTIEQDFDYFIYNITDLVRKSATFWLIRKANTWRRVLFQTAINKLNVEVFDAVTLNLPDISNSPITALVEKASYDSASNAISFECWTPLRSGEKVPYDFAWPADIDELLIFPTIDDRNKGFAGGNNGPNFNVIAPPSSPMSSQNVTVQGFQLACNGKAVRRLTASTLECHEDFGLQKPSDRGDKKPSPNTPSDDSDVQAGYNPLPPSGNSPTSDTCCQEALKTAQEALTEARKAAAAAEGGGGTDGAQPTGTPSYKKLPKAKDKAKDGKCIYQVRVTRTTVTRVQLPDGSQSTKPGAGGDVINDTGRFVEVLGFASLSAAQAFAAGIQQEIHGYEEEFKAHVGDQIPITVTAPIGAMNFGSCTNDTSNPNAMVSYDTESA